MRSVFDNEQRKQCEKRKLFSKAFYQVVVKSQDCVLNSVATGQRFGMSLIIYITFFVRLWNVSHNLHNFFVRLWKSCKKKKKRGPLWPCIAPLADA